MENSWKGWVIDESLNDITILEKFGEIKVLDKKIEENTEGDTKRVWTLYTIGIDDKYINKISKDFEKNIKLEYYAHFTNEKKLLIVFQGKSFIIRLKRVEEDKGFGITSFEAELKDIPIWKSAFEYGTTKGKVDPRYIITVK